MTKVGTGYVAVDADLTPFWAKVERELGGGIGDAKFKAIGGSAGRSLGTGLVGGINTGKLKSIGDDAGRDFARGITQGLAPASTALSKFERDGRASFGAVGDSATAAAPGLQGLYAEITRKNIAPALKDVGSSASKTGRDIQDAAARGSSGLRGLDADARKTSKGFEGLLNAAGGGGGALRGVARSLDGFGGSFGGAAASINGVRVSLALAVPALVAFGGAAVAAAGSLIPLIGVAAAGANAVGGLAVGFGVLKLATAGISGALKEQTTNQIKVGSGAASAAEQQRSAARGIQSAQDGLRTALQQVTAAGRDQKDALRDQKAALAALAPAITAARRAMTDLRAGVTDANLALSGAKLAANDAKDALAALLAGPSPRELADAHQAVTDAVNGEATATRELADAQKALNDILAPPSVLDDADAHDAVADALRGEQRARLNLQKLIEQQNAATQNDGVSASDFADAASHGLSVTSSSSAEDAQQNALDLADAQNAVTDAVRETARAQDNLNKLDSGASQDDVVAARQRVTDAENGVAAATQATANARQNLADIEKPASAADIADARQAVADADNAVTHAITDQIRATQDLAAAEKDGISGSAGVIAAHNAIRASNERVSDSNLAVVNASLAVKRATQSVSDAQLSAKASADGAAASAATLNQKLKALPPAAQAFVKELVSMKPKLDELRQTAAAGFFPGATEGLKAAAKNFDPLKKVIGETADELGDLTHRAGEMVGSPAFGKDLETVGGRNVKVLDTLGSAGLHVASALRNVIVEAGPLTQGLADLTDKWALNAAVASKAARENGSMAAFFQKTRVILTELGSTIEHLAHGLLGIGEAGTKSGNEIWASINRAAVRFDAWTNSAQGKSSLEDFFERSKDLAAAILPVLKNVGGAIGLLALKTLPLTDALKLLGPYAGDVTTAFVSYKLAVAAVGIVTKAATAAAWIYNAALAVQSVNMVRWRITLALAAAQTGLMTAAQWALNVAMDANPIGLIVIGLAALAAGLVYAYTHSAKFREIVGDALRDVGVAFSAMLDAAEAVFGWLKDNWPLVLEILTGPIGLAIAGIRAFGPDLLSAAKWLLDQFISGVEGGLNAIKNVGVWIIDQVVNGIKTLTTGLESVGGWLKNRITDLLHSELDGLRDVGSWIVNRVADGFKTVTDILGSVGGWLKNRIVDLVEDGAGDFGAVGSWVINRVADGIKTITDDLGSVGGWLKNRITDLVTAAKDDFVSVGSSIVDYIVQGLKGGANLLVGFVNKIIDLVEKIPGVPNDLPHVKEFAKGGVNVKGLAEGGAFAKTGGLVSQPIVLMGEEAPKFAEFVIPTNPAYRGRAKMLLAQAAGAIGFADGGIFGTVKGAAGSAIGAVKGLLGKAANALLGLPGVDDLPDWLKDTGKYLLDKVGDWIKNGATSLFGGGSDGGAPAPAGQVKEWLTTALKATGQFTAANLAALYRRTIQESNGNPKAVNLWDSNAKAGHPSKGLLQDIDSTFDAYKLPGHDDIFDPVDNAIASIRYMLAKYGHIVDASSTGYAMGGIFGDLPFGGSFADGGVVPGPLGAPAAIIAHGGETITPRGDGASVQDLIDALGDVDFYLSVGDQPLEQIVDVRIAKSNKQSNAKWKAGVTR